MIIPSFKETPDKWHQQCQSEITDPLPFTLMRGYDLVITITSSFYRPNNLKNLIYRLKEEKRRDQSINHNPSTD